MCVWDLHLYAELLYLLPFSQSYFFFLFSTFFLGTKDQQYKYDSNNNVVAYSLTFSYTSSSCSLSGNYYGTPRPVHIGPESPPITYQEHCNLLRNFRTRSKSLSNLEKATEEEENSEEVSGLSGRFTKDRPLPRKTIWVTNLLQSNIVLIRVSSSSHSKHSVSSSSNSSCSKLFKFETFLWF